MARVIGIRYQDFAELIASGCFYVDKTDFIRTLFNLTFKTNPYLFRGIMTGITRISRESIFQI